MRCAGTTKNTQPCQQPACNAAADRMCFMHSRDPAIERKRVEARRRGGRVSADASLLATPRHCLRFLGAFAGRLEADRTPANIEAATTARAIVEVALKALDVDALERRARDMEAHIIRCRREKRVP